MYNRRDRVPISDGELPQGYRNETLLNSSLPALKAITLSGVIAAQSGALKEIVQHELQTERRRYKQLTTLVDENISFVTEKNNLLEKLIYVRLRSKYHFLVLVTHMGKNLARVMRR